MPYLEPTRSVMYTCCDDGQYKPNSAPRKSNQTRKHTQTRKLGEKYCLARMTATKNLKTGTVSLQYIATHTNHELSLAETKHLPLPQSLKKEVQDKFAKGISLERIMDGEYYSIIHF